MSGSYLHYMNLALKYPNGREDDLMEYLLDYHSVSQKLVHVYLSTKRLIVSTRPGEQMTTPNETLIMPFNVNEDIIEMFYNFSDKRLTAHIVVDGKIEYLHRNIEVEVSDLATFIGRR